MLSRGGLLSTLVCLFQACTQLWTCALHPQPHLSTSPPPRLLPGLVYRAMGFPPQFFTVLFAIPRIAGYLAHWRETLVDPDTKIVRPQQDYRVRLGAGGVGVHGWSCTAM